MAIIGINTTVYDSDGFRQIKQDAGQDLDNFTVSRRATKTATLDGGSVMDDSGYSASDRTYTVKTRDDSGELAAWAERIVKTYSTVEIATRYGFFTGTPMSAWIRDGYLYIEISIISQEDE
jgi:hypothetical protein